MAGPTTFLDRTFALPFAGAELCMEFREGPILHHYNIDSRSNLLGITPSSAVGIRLEELDLEAGLLRLATQAFKQVGLTGATVSYTVKLPHLSEGHEVVVRVIPMRQEDNLDMHYLVVNHVRTVVRPKSENVPDWASIYGQSNDVVFVLNEHYRVAFANAHEGTSFPEVELGSKLIQALEPESRALFSLSLERSLHEFRALQFEYMRTDGLVPRWFSVNINPVRMGRDLYLVVALRETSWMKSQLIALEQEVQVYQSVMSENKAAVVALDESGMVVYANSEANDVPGLLPCGPLVAIASGDVVVLDPRKHVSLNAEALPFAAALAGQHTAPTEVEWAHPASGKSETYMLSVQPNRQHNAEGGGALVFFQPMSEQRLAEQAKLSTYQAMSQLVHTVSHDFRVPINNMVNLCALAKHPSQADRRDQLLDRMDASARQLKEQLDGLMTLVRNGGNTQNTADLCRFKDVWNAVHEDLKDLKTERGALVQAYFDPCPEVRFNAAQLHSILLNLVNNALKYSSPDRQPRVEITSHNHQGFVVLTVRDNGLGMDLNKHENDLWAPFRRIHQNAPGKGLGMALIRNVVEQSGGRIEVESTLGQGTTFYVYLKNIGAPDGQYKLF